MRAYAAFLRAVNLGPANKVAMPALRDLAERLGYTEVATYINSGNLVFDAGGEPPALESELAEAIRREFGHPIEVCVRTREELDRLVAGNPWPEADPRQVTIAFLVGPLPAGAEQRLVERAAAHEPFRLAERDVYVWYGQGLGRSKLAATFGSVIGVSATVRTVRTVGSVLELMNRI